MVRRRVRVIVGLFLVFAGSGIYFATTHHGTSDWALGTWVIVGVGLALLLPV
jgi:hypothetical protein